MEELLEIVTGGAVWGIGFALAAGAVRSLGSGLGPVGTTAMKGVATVGDRVRTMAESGREAVEDIYHEAKAEHQGRAR